jgi:hypothetical protein
MPGLSAGHFDSVRRPRRHSGAAQRNPESINANVAEWCVTLVTHFKGVVVMDPRLRGDDRQRIQSASEREPYPSTKSTSSFTFSTTITAAITPAKAVSHRGVTSAPILAFEAVMVTSGITAKGS